MSLESKEVCGVDGADWSSILEIRDRESLLLSLKY